MRLPSSTPMAEITAFSRLSCAPLSASTRKVPSAASRSTSSRARHMAPAASRVMMPVSQSMSTWARVPQISQPSMTSSSATWVGLTMKPADCRGGLVMWGFLGNYELRIGLLPKQVDQQGVLGVHAVAGLGYDYAVRAVEHAVCDFHVAARGEAVHEAGVVGEGHDFFVDYPVLEVLANGLLGVPVAVVAEGSPALGANDIGPLRGLVHAVADLERAPGLVDALGGRGHHFAVEVPTLGEGQSNVAAHIAGGEELRVGGGGGQGLGVVSPGEHVFLLAGLA